MAHPLFFRRFFIGACLLLAPFLVLLTSQPVKAGPYLVFDVASGEVLAENQAFDPWYPASLTKLMTAYVTFRALKQKKVSLQSPVVMSARAAGEPPSKMGFKPGTIISVDAALKIILVKSANDVAVALAEAVAGSEAAFVAAMNQEAARLGMVGTRFMNANGLPDGRQWTTARDFALLARAIIRDFPEHYHLFRITGLSLGGKVIKTHNHLLERFPGTEGMKTGFICASGFNVVASVSRGGRRLVAVVMGEKNALIRAEKTAQLLEEAFAARRSLFARRETLDALRPQTAPPTRPVTMRESVCGKNKNAGEDAEAVAKAGETGEKKSFLVPPFSLMPPVVLSLGAPGAEIAEEVDAALLPLPRPNPARADGHAPGLADVPPLDGPPITILGSQGG